MPKIYGSSNDSFQVKAKDAGKTRIKNMLDKIDSLDSSEISNTRKNQNQEVSGFIDFLIILISC